MAADDTIGYELRLAAGQMIALYFQAMDDRLQLEVKDPGGRAIAWVSDDDNRGNLHRRYANISATDAGTYTVGISAPGSTGGAFRVLPARVDGDPESADPALILGTTVTERLEHPADLDEFTFRLAPGEQAIAFLQQLDPGPSAIGGSVRLVEDPGPFAFRASVRAVLPTDDLELNASGRFGAPSGGTYKLSVRREPGFGFGSDPNETFASRYRLQVRRIDPRPEQAAPSLVSGDTVSESIDHVGDVDVFTLSDSPGAEYNIFVAADGATPHQAAVTVDLVEDFHAGANPGTPLLRNPTGRFSIPATGQVEIRVTDGRDRQGLYRGPYRLYAHRVDRNPENRAAGITLATGPLAGAIDVPGDIDEYTFTTTVPTLANLSLVRQPEGAIGKGLTVELLPSGGGPHLASTLVMERYQTGIYDPAATGRFALPAGSYRIRVQGQTSGVIGFMGSYLVELHPIRPEPEVRSAAVAIGDTIRGESLDPAGDVDTFIFSATASDTFTVALTPAPGDTLRNHSMALLSRQSGAPIAFPNYGTIWYGRGYLETGRLVLPAGEYEVRVETNGRTLAERGPYQVLIERVSAAPERRESIIAVGDTVRGEAIDVPGDIDAFTLQGTPGQAFGVGFRWMRSGMVHLEIVNPATGAVLVSQGSAGYLQHTGMTVFPSSGELIVRVLEPDPACNIFNPCNLYPYEYAGEYTFYTFALDRRPEVNAPTISIGDTITGDRIDPPGDVDEFTFPGLAGQVVEAYFQTPQGTCCFGGLTLDLVDPASGAVLGAIVGINPTARLEDRGTGRVTLPGTRDYMVRVRGTDERYGTGVYRFQVVAH